MKLTQHFVIKEKYNGYQYLEEVSQECGNCWNTVVEISNEYYKNNKKWISSYNIQKIIDETTNFNLHAHTIDGICDKFCANRITIASLRKSGNKKAKYPYKKKRYYIIPIKKSAMKRKDGQLKISLGNKRYLILPFDNKIADAPSYAEITFKNNQYVFYYVLEAKEYEPIITNIKCGVDLGEIHSISATTDSGSSIIITNRKGRSIKHYRNKIKYELNKMINRCKKKTSKRCKRLKKAKYKMCNKCRNQLKNLYHQTTAKFIDFCVSNNVDEIIVGNCAGVGNNTKHGNKKQRKRKCVREKLSQFEVGTLKTFLKYKSELNGIKYTLITEEYTSQLCPICGNKHKVSGRNYKCPICGYINHRDINGAWNILTKYYQNIFTLPKKFDIIHIRPLK